MRDRAAEAFERAEARHKESGVSINTSHPTDSDIYGDNGADSFAMKRKKSESSDRMHNIQGLSDPHERRGSSNT